MPVRKKTSSSFTTGFTLIEIIVVVSILIVIISFGMTIDLNAFKRDAFLAEQSKIVSVLTRARSHAMANMFDKNHGVCYIAPDYVIFQGSKCDNGESIPADPSIATTSNFLTSFPSIVFERLTGNTLPATIHITDGIKEGDITINDEGAINW